MWKQGYVVTLTVNYDLESHYCILYHPQIVPVLIAQSVVIKSAQGGKNMAQTQNKLGHSTNSEQIIIAIIHIEHLQLVTKTYTMI